MKSRVLAPLIVIVAGFLVSLTALAGNSSVVSSARELAKQGLQAYDAGRYEEAAEKLGKAYEVVHVPTLAVNQARALVKLGKLVAASELYLEAQRIPKEKSWQSSQTEAQRDAEKERADLLPRIPRLTIVIHGAQPTEVEVILDGNAVPAALLDAEQLGDPGTHTVRGTRGAEAVTESISVKEGQHATVTLRFAQKSAAVPPFVSTVPNQQNNAQPLKPGAPAPSNASRMGNAAPQPAATSSKGSTQKTVGWIGIGMGGAGLIVGGITGLMAISKRNSLNDSHLCSSDLKHCAPEASGRVDSYDGLRTVSTIGFYAGGVLAVTGVTLLLTSPKQESRANVGLSLSPNGASLTGGF